MCNLRSLYIQALAAMQNADDSDPLSYFQVAGECLMFVVWRTQSDSGRYSRLSISSMEQLQYSSRSRTCKWNMGWLLYPQ